METEPQTNKMTYSISLFFSSLVSPRQVFEVLTTLSFGLIWIQKYYQKKRSYLVHLYSLVI